MVIFTSLSNHCLCFVMAWLPLPSVHSHFLFSSFEKYFFSSLFFNSQIPFVGSGGLPWSRKEKGPRGGGIGRVGEGRTDRRGVACGLAACRRVISPRLFLLSRAGNCYL